MKKFIFKAKNIILISPLLFLMNSPALSHTTKSSEFGMSHAFLSFEHSLPLALIGVLVGFLMISQKRSLIIAGNIGLLGFLAFLGACILNCEAKGQLMLFYHLFAAPIL